MNLNVKISFTNYTLEYEAIYVFPFEKRLNLKLK